MLTRNELYQNALRTVSRRRQIARANAELARQEAEAAIPSLRSAEDELRVRGVRCAIAGASGVDRAAATAALQQAEKKLDDLLIASGRSPLCLKPKYTCKKCQDTGFDHGKTCTCVLQVMKETRRKEIESLSALSITSFDSLNMNYYPSSVDPTRQEDVRTYMTQLLLDLRSYAKEFDLQSENLLLGGNAGLGKTHSALAIAGIVLEKGYDVIYVSCPNYFSRLETLWSTFDSTGERDVLLNCANEADLLILDDLGAEINSNFATSTLYMLLNNRLGAKRPTIITTNIVDDVTMKRRYTDKIWSRVASFSVFSFLGDDIRQIKASEE